MTPIDRSASYYLHFRPFSAWEISRIEVYFWSIFYMVYFLPQANIRSNPANQSVALRIYAEGSEDKWCTSTTPINAEHQKLNTQYNPEAQTYSPEPCDHSALIFDTGHCVIME